MFKHQSSSLYFTLYYCYLLFISATTDLQIKVYRWIKMVSHDCKKTLCCGCFCYWCCVNVQTSGFISSSQITVIPGHSREWAHLAVPAAVEQTVVAVTMRRLQTGAAGNITRKNYKRVLFIYSFQRLTVAHSFYLRLLLWVLRYL